MEKQLPQGSRIGFKRLMPAKITDRDSRMKYYYPKGVIFFLNVVGCILIILGGFFCVSGFDDLREMMLGITLIVYSFGYFFAIAVLKLLYSVVASIRGLKEEQ